MFFSPSFVFVCLDEVLIVGGGGGGDSALIYWVQPEDENAPVTPESSRRKAVCTQFPL